MSFENWWGKKFGGRGSIDLTNMPDNSIATIKKLSTENLLELIRSEDTRSVRGLCAHMEIRRREQWTARVALLISVISVAIGMANFGANFLQSSTKVTPLEVRSAAK